MATNFSEQIAELIQRAVIIGQTVGAQQNLSGEASKTMAAGVLSAPIASTLVASTAALSAHKTARSFNDMAGDAQSDGDQSSKRRQSGKKKPKKEEVTIKDISRIPVINEQKLKELMAQSNFLPENQDWEIKLTEKSNDPDWPYPDIHKDCSALQLARNILNAHQDLLTEEDRALSSKKGYGRWFKLCAMSLIVAILRRKIWDNEPYDQEDLRITPAEIPSTLAKKVPKPEGAGKKDTKHKVRASKYSTYTLWQALIRQNPENAALLNQYELGDASKVFSAKWDSDKKKKSSEPATAAAATVRVVSPKTRAFLEKLLLAEAWDQQLELFFAYIERSEALQTAAPPTPAE